MLRRLCHSQLLIRPKDPQIQEIMLAIEEMHGGSWRICPEADVPTQKVGVLEFNGRNRWRDLVNSPGILSISLDSALFDLCCSSSLIFVPIQAFFHQISFLSMCSRLSTSRCQVCCPHQLIVLFELNFRVVSRGLMWHFYLECISMMANRYLDICQLSDQGLILSVMHHLFA